MSTRPGPQRVGVRKYRRDVSLGGRGENSRIGSREAGPESRTRPSGIKGSQLRLGTVTVGLVGGSGREVTRSDSTSGHDGSWWVVTPLLGWDNLFCVRYDLTVGGSVRRSVLRRGSSRTRWTPSPGIFRLRHRRRVLLRLWSTHRKGIVGQEIKRHL